MTYKPDRDILPPTNGTAGATPSAKRRTGSGMFLAILAALLLVGGFMLYSNSGERVANNASTATGASTTTGTTTGVSKGEQTRPAFPDAANTPAKK